MNFNLNNETLGFTINVKIIVNSILGLDKIYSIITKENEEDEINFELTEYNKNEEEIQLKNIIDDIKVIYLYQYEQGKNYDGGVLIPIKDKPGFYILFLYQSSIKKKEKFVLKDLVKDFNIIKKKIFEYFGIVIEEGYFSYILYYEEKDVETIYHCKDENIGYFFYSFNSNTFVDDKGNNITSIMNYKNLINKKIELSQFTSIKKSIRNIEKHFKKEIKVPKRKISYKPQSNKMESIYLGKKIVLSKVNNEQENKKIHFKNLTNLNLCLKEKLKELDPNIKDKKARVIKSKSYDKLNKDLEIENDELIKKIKNIKNISLDEEESSEDDEDRKQNNKQLPKEIKNIFPGYNNYRDYGNYFILGMEYPEFPFIIIYEYENEFLLLQYKQKGEIIQYNIKTKKLLSDEEKKEYFTDLFSGKFKFHLWELYEK